MNARLKALARQKNISESAIERMCELVRDDAFVERVLNDTTFMQAMADAMGVRYQERGSISEIISFKAAEPKPQIELVDYYQVLFHSDQSLRSKR